MATTRSTDTGAKGSGQQEPGRASARDALDRARLHARNAVSETLAAVHALIDAASIAANGAPADAHPALRTLTRSIDEMAEQLASGGTGVSPAIIEAVLDALDAEIARWERRSAEDSEARPVLRAFLGVREILWEVGLRRSGGEQSSGATPPSRPAAEGGGVASPKTARRRQRVQRLNVQG